MYASCAHRGVCCGVPRVAATLWQTATELARRYWSTNAYMACVPMTGQHKMSECSPFGSNMPRKHMAPWSALACTPIKCYPWFSQSGSPSCRQAASGHAARNRRSPLLALRTFALPPGRMRQQQVQQLRPLAQPHQHRGVDAQRGPLTYALLLGTW